MIVCHCNVICCTRIMSAIESAMAEDAGRRVTPADVYRHCQAVPHCGRCKFHICGMIERSVCERASTERACVNSEPPRPTSAQASGP